MSTKFYTFQPETLSKVRTRRFQVWHFPWYLLNLFWCNFYFSLFLCLFKVPLEIFKTFDIFPVFFSFLLRYSPKIPVPLSYLELLSFHSSFLHCLNPHKTFLNCSWRCDFVNTGWFYFDISLFCCSLPYFFLWFPLLSLENRFVSFYIFPPAHLYVSFLCFSFQSGLLICRNSLFNCFTCASILLFHHGFSYCVDFNVKLL